MHIPENFNKQQDTHTQKTPRHNVIKLLKNKNKENTLQLSKEKKARYREWNKIKNDRTLLIKK